MWEYAVEVGVAAFVGLPGAPASTVEARLVELGLTPTLARHLVTWIPEAFALRAFTKLEVVDTYAVAHGGRGSLSEEPVFQAALSRAELASREEVYATAPHGSILAAVNSAAQAGAELSGRVAITLLEALPRLEASDRPLAPIDAFRAFLDSHGITRLPDGTTIDAPSFLTITSEDFRLQVDFVVRDPRLAGGTVVESFGGFGPTLPIANANAIEKFERGSVHVLIATLFDRSSCGDHVTWERWPHVDGAMSVCLGAQLLLMGAGGPPLVPVLDALIQRLRTTPLTSAIHALRVFTYRDPSGTVVDEVLLDGEPWLAGLDVLASELLPRVAEPWSTRLFALVER